MILKIRTKDNLQELIRHGNSPSWVISESKIQHIKNVEIYQFDGKKVIKGKFDITKSSRTESGRLIVGFNEATIEDSNYKWIGQNPIKYESIEDNVIEFEENNKVFLIAFSDGSIETMNDFTDFVFEKSHLINNFLTENIDSNTKSFLILDFNFSDDMKELKKFIHIDDKSIKSEIEKNVDFEINNNNLSIEDLRVKIITIFNPKEDELEIWKNEFLDLSAFSELSLTIYGENYEFGNDLIFQQYDNGNWEEGAIACDQGYIEDCSLEEYIYTDSPDSFPDNSFFRINTYSNF